MTTTEIIVLSLSHAGLLALGLWLGHSLGYADGETKTHEKWRARK